MPESKDPGFVRVSNAAEGNSLDDFRLGRRSPPIMF